jgi:hypothetical protein
MTDRKKERTFIKALIARYYKIEDALHEKYYVDDPLGDSYGVSLWDFPDKKRDKEVEIAENRMWLIRKKIEGINPKIAEYTF